ncbi:phage/plasmid primase, P4 family [Desulfobacter postgatei]|uniref:phage/plasmid primase, P4 family n=1 Tax=Desulfobacter postgatei TaxID=2293 RepID=UPI002A3664BB|nr:phage/plasmid primase, P4 family [Desulfobacter postgatei]MDX9963956.1 phage/plasmid primase, P4 family [Desulfobacter postgatei]
MNAETQLETVARIVAEYGCLSGEIRVNCLCQDGQGQDKTLGVNIDTGVYHCHRCGIKGNYLKVNGFGSEKKPLAQYILDHSLSMTSHPYTEKKQIKPIEIKVDKHSNWVTPYYDSAGQLQTLQLISLDKKHFLSKAKNDGQGVTGSAYKISGNNDVVYVCEGPATGHSIHEATGATVYCVGGKENFKHVLPWVKEKHQTVIVAADNESNGDGLRAASKAAIKNGLKIVVPPTKGMDFNDYAVSAGLDSVKAVLEDPKEPAPPNPGDAQNDELDDYLSRFGLSRQDIINASFEEQKGCADIARQVLKNQFCFDHAAGRWYKFAGHYWVSDATGETIKALDVVQDLFKRVESNLRGAVVILGQQIQTADQAQKESIEMEVNALEKQKKALQASIHNLNGLYHRKQVAEFATLGPDSLGITGDEWDRDPYALPCKNGVVDLRTGDLKPGRPEQYLKAACPTEYHKSAVCKQFERSLMEICGNDTELFCYIQRMLGQALVGANLEHKLFILWGAGRNGKDTLLETIKFVLGEKLAGPVQSELLLDQGRLKSSSGPSADIMRLRGLRIAWASETNEGRRMDTGKVKLLTDGGDLVGRAPYGRKEVSFPQSFSLMLLTNNKPHAPAEDFALWQRIHLIPFGTRFVDDPQESNERKKDPHLWSKLQAEAEGILAFLVAGCLEWQEHGLCPPEIVTKSTDEYRTSEDLLQLFIDEACIVGPGYTAKAKSLFDHYKKWMTENGLKPLSGTKFGLKITERYEKTKGKTGTYYQDIGIMDDI